MVGDIFSTIGEVVTSFTSTLGNVFNGITSLVYNSTDGTMTLLGVLLLIGAGVGLVWGAFRLIRGAIQNAA